MNEPTPTQVTGPATDLVTATNSLPPVEPVTWAPLRVLLKVRVFSFGYLWHTDPAELTADGQCHAVLDLRKLLYNPFHDPAMRELTGLDETVHEHVLATPGATDLVAAMGSLALTVLAQVDHAYQAVTVGFGCAGGRHRSVVLANALGHLLNTNGVGAEVTHYDVLRPVYQHPTGRNPGRHPGR